jgi:hypothetical protein
MPFIEQAHALVSYEFCADRVDFDVILAWCFHFPFILTVDTSKIDPWDVS